MIKFLRTGFGLLFMLVASLALADADPPGRVARLNYLDGDVSLSPTDGTDWIYATLNRPLTTGDQLWVDRGGRAELHVDSTALRADGQTSLSLLTLDDDTLQIKVAQGSLAFTVRELDAQQSMEIDTPNLAFVINRPGQYRIDVDPDADTTRVVIRRGEGDALGDDDADVVIHGRQEIVFSGTQLFERSTDLTPARDHFDDWADDRDRREEQSASAHYVSRDVIGYEDLDANGIWQDEDGYGPVWRPRVVVAGWAPYRFGHWEWIGPWGWTWIDDAPWGFAPFHYGRWARIRNDWCWVPGPIAIRPVYAPALVAFASGGSGGSRWGVSLNIGGPGPAWFPLGPGEPFHPAYAASSRYVARVNVHTNVIVNNVYVNQRVPDSITAMRAEDFVKGQSAQKARLRIDPAALRDAHVAEAPAIAPTRESWLGNARRADSPLRKFSANSQRPVIAVHAPIVPPAAAAQDRFVRQRDAAQRPQIVPGVRLTHARSATSQPTGAQDRSHPDTRPLTVQPVQPSPPERVMRPRDELPQVPNPARPEVGGARRNDDISIRRNAVQTPAQPAPAPAPAPAPIQTPAPRAPHPDGAAQRPAQPGAGAGLVTPPPAEERHRAAPAEPARERRPEQREPARATEERRVEQKPPQERRGANPSEPRPEERRHERGSERPSR